MQPVQQLLQSKLLSPELACAVVGFSLSITSQVTEPSGSSSCTPSELLLQHLQHMATDSLFAVLESKAALRKLIKDGGFKNLLELAFRRADLSSEKNDLSAASISQTLQVRVAGAKRASEIPEEQSKESTSDRPDRIASTWVNKESAASSDLSLRSRNSSGAQAEDTMCEGVDNSLFHEGRVVNTSSLPEHLVTLFHGLSKVMPQAVAFELLCSGSLDSALFEAAMDHTSAHCTSVIALASLREHDSKDKKVRSKQTYGLVDKLPT